MLHRQPHQWHFLPWVPGFEGRKAIKKIKPTMIATFIKLIALPAIYFPFAIAMGFRESALVAILIMSAPPQRLPAISWPKIWEMMMFCPPVSLLWQPCCHPSH